jgi:hypothetical protein
MACNIWRVEYNDRTDPENGLPDEDVNTIDEIPVYSINNVIC